MMNSEINSECTFVDENGVPVVHARQRNHFPEDVLFSMTSPADLSRVNTLVTQTCQGVIGTHGRTVELVFEPHIQKGLKDGTLSMMKTKTGETLADAVRVRGEGVGQIAGKGRIIEGGKLRQIATGSFQLISLVVAQAHLADINKNLVDIKSSLELLHQKIDNGRLATIHGRIDYLEGLIDKLRRGDFDYDVSLQIKNKIEATVADAHEWQSLLFADLKTLISSAYDLKDTDTFGTGGTYQNLKLLTDNLQPIIQRRNMMLRLSALLAYLLACIDPTNKEFSEFDLKREAWESDLNKFITIINKKSNNYLIHAKFNSKEMLEHRRFYISNTLERIKAVTESNQAQYDINLLNLKSNHRKVLSETKKLRLAVSFDQNGNADKAAVVD